jgi:ADP-ribose pyrophosphatase YjhB (NUDIX family)
MWPCNGSSVRCRCKPVEKPLHSSLAGFESTADKLLLIRHTYGHSGWTLSGGGIKKGETKEEAVKREVKEELGLDITPEYIGEFTHTTEYKGDTVYCFVVRIEKVEPKIDHGEIREAKWWNINNLPEDHSTRLERVLLMYQSR